MKRREAQTFESAGANPVTRTDFFGMSTGQASRASVLTGACLRAGGALRLSRARSAQDSRDFLLQNASLHFDGGQVLARGTFDKAMRTDDFPQETCTIARG
jgi:hypothetical protein